jgi:nicotinate (nicotinamide) nucleotide adenylyltransferase
VQFVRRAQGRVSARPHRLGILAGSFNPPTRAHAALIEAAAPHVDEVLCVLPRVFPHKLYFGASLEDRLRMLEAAAPDSIAVVERGLFIDIASECRDAYGPEADLIFLCGRDAAERIIEWDYGKAGAIDRMLKEFRLLVAARHGRYDPPPQLAHRVGSLAVDAEIDEISSTAVRDRIRRGDPIGDLVPASIREMVEQIYRQP